MTNLENSNSEIANYVLKIYSSFNESEISTIVWIFDSKDQGCENNEASWGCVESEGLNWY